MDFRSNLSGMQKKIKETCFEASYPMYQKYLAKNVFN